MVSYRITPYTIFVRCVKEILESQIQFIVDVIIQQLAHFYNQNKMLKRQSKEKTKIKKIFICATITIMTVMVIIIDFYIYLQRHQHTDKCSD